MLNIILKELLETINIDRLLLLFTKILHYNY